MITTSRSQFCVWLRLLEHTVVLPYLYNNLFTNKRTTNPISTPVNTSHSQSNTELDYASSMSLSVKTMFPEAAVCGSRCLIYMGFQFRIATNDTCMHHKTTHTHTYTHRYTYKNTKVELQNSYFTTRHTLFLGRNEMLAITTFRCDCLSGEGEATEICGQCQVAVLSRMKVVRRVIDSTYL